MFLVIAVTALSATFGTQQANHRKLIQRIDPSDSRVAYTGRWNFSDPDRPWCGWQGASFVVNFNGTKLWADLDAGTLTEYFRVIIDDDHARSKKIAVTSSRATYALTPRMPLGVHKVEVVKESYAGRNATLFGLEVRGVGLDEPPVRPLRKIEFYGDSNLAGYSLENEQNNGANVFVGCHFGYAGITARMFAAEYHNVSASGETISSLHNRYDRMDWWTPNPQWDFGNFLADLVVVNLGANDVGSPVNQIKADYHAFLDDLRAVHPNAHIMLFNSWGWDFDEPANYIHEVIAERNDSDMSSAIFPWLFEQWHGCEFDHAGMANVLAEHVSNVLGWTYAPADVVSGYGVGGDVANGGFEQDAPFGGFGWRYKDAPGVTRMNDPDGAYEGGYFARLTNADEIHQPNPANNGNEVMVTWWARGPGANDEMDVVIDFRSQQIYTVPLQVSTETFALTNVWQQFSMRATAPSNAPDPVYQTRLTLKARPNSTVDVDGVVMSTQ
ncbi:MAG: hypothetical protein CMJ89_12945 [Planctomycetes bacterium]|jgi:hypothetical protein|nr:hypothetical protein [Planctomycetota bacterium]